MREEIIHDLLVGLDIAPCGCPADHSKLMVVALANGVGAMFHEQANDGKAMLFDCEVQRKRGVSLAPDVGVGSALQQELHRRFAVAEDCLMESGSHAGAARP